MLLARSIAFTVVFYIATAVIAFVGLPFMVSRDASRRYAQMWGRVCLWLLRVVGGISTEFRGLDSLPKGPLLIAPKHQSTLETIALTVPFDRFAFVLKRELLWIPLFGWFLWRSGMVPINRAKGAKTMVALNAAAAEAIADGRQLIVFPEGTRRPAGAPPAYKQGLSHLYRALGVPCVPLALNTGLYWPRRSLSQLPGHAVIEFLPAIPPGLPRSVFQAELQTRLETATNLLLEEGRADLAAQGFSPPREAASDAG